MIDWNFGQVTSAQMGWVTNLKVGDVNHDGVPDFFLGSDSFTKQSPAFLLVGQADGTLVIGTELPARYTPREAVFGDLNGDGIDDIFVANTGPDTSPAPGERDTLMLSDGSGGYLSTPVPGGKKAFSHGAAISDVDRDGDLDIFVATNGNQKNAQPFFLINDGSGDFSLDRSILPKSVARQNHDRSDVRYQVAHLEDLNGDGWDDLVLGKQEEPGEKSRISKVFFSDHGAFSDKNAINLNDHTKLKHAQEVIDIGAVDLDGDGQKELLVLSQGRRANAGYTDEWTLQAFEQSDKKGVVDRTARFFGEDAYVKGSLIPYFLDFQDINQDGLMDILTYMPGGGSATASTPAFYLNTGDGKMELVTLADIVSEDDLGFFNSNVAPFFHDGMLDFLRFDSDDAGTISIAAVNMISPLPKIGDGTGLVAPGSGKHRIEGTGDPEALFVTAADDLIFGYLGDDTISGGPGNDNLLGGDGDDAIAGGSGEDVIRGENGNDIISTGSGADMIVFASVDGMDVVTDFSARGRQHDILDLSQVGAIKNFQDLKSDHLERHGSDVLVNASFGNSILLEDVKIRDLDASDFLF